MNHGLNTEHHQPNRAEPNVKKIDSEIFEFIMTSRWCFAKTMPQCPHEYIVREWRLDKEQVFECFVMLIRERGYDDRFLNATYRYLEIDGWKYWTMGATLNGRVQSVFNQWLN